MGRRKQHVIIQAQNFQKNNRETSPETLGNTIITPVPQSTPDYNSNTTSNEESDDDEELEYKNKKKKKEKKKMR